MSVTKFSIAEKLIEDYVNNPPSLKEQSLIRLAIYLCQNTELKKDILYETEPPKSTGAYLADIQNVWEKPIEKRSDAICDILCIPSALKPELVLRIWRVALEIFCWTKRYEDLLQAVPDTADQFLLPSDWSIEGRLVEIRITERLVRDVRIPLGPRYQMACLCCFTSEITSLWLQISPEIKEEFYRKALYYNNYLEGSGLVELWSCHLAKYLVYERFITENEFWQHGLNEAIEEGETIAVIHCWEALSEDKRQEIVIDIALKALKKSRDNNIKVFWMWSCIWATKCSENNYPTFYTDILYFIYSQMSEEQTIVFLQYVINMDDAHMYRNEARFFRCFLQWPYQEFFLTIIARIWGILSEKKFHEILLMIMYRYTNQDQNPTMEKEYLDYDYGTLLVKFVEQAPENYKRYLFNYEEGSAIKIFCSIFCYKPFFVHMDIWIIQSIFKHATSDEKESFIRSSEGVNICAHLIKRENWKLVDCIVSECLPEEEISGYKKLCLDSSLVKELYLDFIKKDDEKDYYFFLNWACDNSEKEISDLKSKIFSDEQSNFFSYAVAQQIDWIEKIIKRCLPNKKAQEDFKEQWIAKNGTIASYRLIVTSKWEEAMEFLNWCFPEKDSVEKFKKDFFAQKSIEICHSLMLDHKWETAETFFQWYNLSSKDIIRLKKETFCRFDFLRDIYLLLCDEEELKVIPCLRWGLVDDVSVKACKKAFKEVQWKNKIPSFDKIKDQLTQAKWKKLIEERLSDLKVSKNKEQGQSKKKH